MAMLASSPAALALVKREPGMDASGAGAGTGTAGAQVFIKPEQVVANNTTSPAPLSGLQNYASLDALFAMCK